MKCRDQPARPGVEMLLMNAGQNYALHAPIVAVIWPGERFPAIDGDLVATVHKRRTHLLGKLFEAAVAIGNASRTDDGNLQERSPERTCLPSGRDHVPAGSEVVSPPASIARGVSLNHQMSSRSGTRRLA